MSTSTNGNRSLLFVAALLFTLVALGIAGLIIPAALADSYPQATPERAAMALAVSAGLNLLLAMSSYVLARRLSDQAPGRAWIRATLGVVAILVNLVLFDAVEAFAKHGPQMASTKMLLAVAAALGIIAGILLIVSALLTHKLSSQTVGQPLQ